MDPRAVVDARTTPVEAHVQVPQAVVVEHVVRKAARLAARGQVLGPHTVWKWSFSHVVERGYDAPFTAMAFENR